MLGRRYIWDGWSTIQERIFSNYEVETEEGSEEWIEVVPTESDAHSKAERVYVNGASIDEPLFVAIDGDMDGNIGDEDPAVFTSVNLPEYEKPEDTIQQVTGRNDFAYYYLNNRMGSITALLARNLEATEPLELSEESHESARILEYYRYSAYGNVTVLPVHDDGSAYSKVASGLYDATGNDMGSGSRKAWDRVEDTPLDLADNNTIMLLRREADGTYSHLSARADYGRVSQFGNSFTFTARRQDPHTGLMYYRYRMYEPVTGRFVGRDPLGQFTGSNEFHSVLNRPGAFRDPDGLIPVSVQVSALDAAVTFTVTSFSPRPVPLLHGPLSGSQMTVNLATIPVPMFSTSGLYINYPNVGWPIGHTQGSVYSIMAANMPLCGGPVPGTGEPRYEPGGSHNARSYTSFYGNDGFGTAFFMLGENQVTAANAIRPASCCEIRQEVKHDAGAVPTLQPELSSVVIIPGVWHEDIGWDDGRKATYRYGHRRGAFASQSYDYNIYLANNNGQWTSDMLNGTYYRGYDAPGFGGARSASPPGWVGKNWEFRLKMVDVCSPWTQNDPLAAPISTSSVLTLRW